MFRRVTEDRSADGKTERRVSFESLDVVRLAPSDAAAYAGLARFEVAIAVGRSTIAVRFSRRSAARAFAERFGDMLGVHAPDAIVYAVDLPGEALFWFAPDRTRRWPAHPSDEVLVFFADNVALHEYLTTSPYVGMHAAVLAKASHVVALVGSSTAGKTTTAIAAVREGFTLYSDERCILEDACVVPFLRAITLREGSRSALLAEAEPGRAIDVRLRAMPAHGDTAIRPRLLLGEQAGGPPRRLDAMFLICDRGATPSVERRSLYSVLPALLRSMISRDTGLERAARLIAELRDIPLFSLRLGTPGATARAIEKTLAPAAR